MANESNQGIPVQDTEIPSERNFTLDDLKVTINHEIAHYEANKEQSYSKLAEFLYEAKLKYGRHGGWQDWLKENIEMPVYKCQRLLRVAKLLRNATPALQLEQLPFSHVYILTRISETKLAAFMKVTHRVGDKGEKYVAEMSKRELEEVVKTYLQLRRLAEGSSEQSQSTSQASSSLIDRQFAKIKNEVINFVQQVQAENHTDLAEDLRQFCDEIALSLSQENLEVPQSKSSEPAA